MQTVLFCVFLLIMSCGISNCKVSASNVDGVEQYPANKADQASDTCDVKLTQLLQYHQGSVPELQQQVEDNLATIVRLKDEILHAENTLKFVSDEATDFKKIEMIFIEKHEELQKQLNNIFNKLGSSSPPCDNLKAENDKLQRDLITASSTIQQLTVQLANNKKQTNLKDSERTVEMYRTRHGLPNDNIQILASACEGGDTGAVSALLSLGVSCETHINSNHGTCLLQAAGKNRLELVKMLVTSGCDKNAKYKGNLSTAIQEAAYRGFLEVVRVLAEHGADLTLRSTNGNKTALGWARYHGKTQVVDYLVSIRATE